MRRTSIVLLCVFALSVVAPAPGALAATAQPHWTDTYSFPGGLTGAAIDVVIAPDGSRVFVVGVSDTATTEYDFVTIAIDPATGRELWSSRYDTSYHRSDRPSAIEVSPDG